MWCQFWLQMQWLLHDPESYQENGILNLFLVLIFGHVWILTWKLHLTKLGKGMYNHGSIVCILFPFFFSLLQKKMEIISITWKIVTQISHISRLHLNLEAFMPDWVTHFHHHIQHLFDQRGGYLILLGPIKLFVISY